MEKDGKKRDIIIGDTKHKECAESIASLESNNCEMTSRTRRMIIFELLLSFICVVSVCVVLGGQNGSVKIASICRDYFDYVEKWAYKQEFILESLSDSMVEHKDVLLDESLTSLFLKDINDKYEDISLVYVTNPHFENNVFTSNGNTSDIDIYSREWYTGAVENEGEVFVSDPYIDAQTSRYCITFSKALFDEDGMFLGVMGIDYSLDSVMSVFEEGYSEDGYSFVIDSNSNIVNHPNPDYRLSLDKVTTLSELEKGFHIDLGGNIIYKDYDGKIKITSKLEDEQGRFSCIVVKNFVGVYSTEILISFVALIVFSICCLMVFRLYDKLIRWQKIVQNNMKNALDEAVAADNAKSEFLAVMSHEIRTPINSILGLNELIIRENDREDVAEHSKNIKSVGRSLLALINSILDFSKIEKGEVVITNDKYEVPELVRDCINIVKVKAASQQLELKVFIAPDVNKYLIGDITKIRQIIYNLLSNAVKYTNKGSVELKIRQLPGDEEGKAVLCVNVIDTGIGIKQEEFAEFKERYIKTGLKKKICVDGSGIGLYIVSGLLENMGSALQVESKEGEGSDFGFEIVQGISDNEKIDSNYLVQIDDEVKDKRKEKYIYSSEARVLVVDDNEINRNVAEGLMKKNGIIPDTVGSGRECLEIVKEHKYHIIFLDHMMPEMDGIETLNKLRHMKEIDGTKIIVLTANAVIGASVRYKEAGFDDYLSKPIDIDELENIFLKYLPKDILNYKKNGISIVRKKNTSEEETGIEEINTELGMKYCGGKKELYEAVLKKYANGTADKKLTEYLDKGDIENYRIEVHALKSNSKSIGALLFSEDAYKMEQAAKDGKLSYLQSNHSDFMKHYRKVKEACLKITV